MATWPAPCCHHRRQPCPQLRCPVARRLPMGRRPPRCPPTREVPQITPTGCRCCGRLAWGSTSSRIPGTPKVRWAGAVPWGMKAGAGSGAKDGSRPLGLPTALFGPTSPAPESVSMLSFNVQLVQANDNENWCVRKKKDELWAYSVVKISFLGCQISWRFQW